MTGCAPVLPEHLRPVAARLAAMVAALLAAAGDPDTRKLLAFDIRGVWCGLPSADYRALQSWVEHTICDSAVPSAIDAGGADPRRAAALLWCTLQPHYRTREGDGMLCLWPLSADRAFPHIEAPISTARARLLLDDIRRLRGGVAARLASAS